MEKVSVDTVKPWISQRINEILGFEDEVVIDFVFNMLETERVMQNSEFQLSLAHLRIRVNHHLYFESSHVDSRNNKTIYI